MTHSEQADTASARAASAWGVDTTAPAAVPDDAAPPPGEWDSPACAAALIREERDRLLVLVPEEDPEEPKSDAHSYAVFRAPDGVLNYHVDAFTRRSLAYLAEGADDDDAERAARYRSRMDNVLAFARRVRDALPAVARVLFEPGDRPKEAPEHLVDTRFAHVGAQNGVVSLREGRLLTAAEVHADNVYVRSRCTVDFKPNARHAEADRLFEHQPAEVADFLWDAIAWSITGDNRRRFYVVHGGTEAGKTTTLDTLEGVLGPYHSEVPQSALGKVRSDARDQATGDIGSFVAPALFAAVDEPKTNYMDAATLKHLAGGRTTIKYRPLHGNNRTGVITSTLWMFCNHVPNVGAIDKALARRLIVVPVAPIKRKRHVVRDLASGTHADAEQVRLFREAVLAKLVRRAKRLLAKGEPPQPPPTVAKATRLAISMDRGLLGELVDRIRPGHDSDFLSNDDCWEAWAELNDTELYSHRGERLGGFTKRSLQSKLVSQLADIYPDRPFRPDPDSPKSGGKRGRWGWTLAKDADS